jgi:sugar lactone lactonase YvrE
LLLPAAAAGQARRIPRFEKVVGETAGLGWVNDPIGIAVSPADDGRVYVVDRGNARVQVFSPTGQSLGAWSSRGNGRHQFWQPSDIAVSPDGRFVYVVDQGHKRVQRFEPALDCFLPGGRDCFSANRVQIFGYGGQLKDPTGLAVDREGRVYVADTVLHKVVVYDADGTKVDSFGEPGSGRGELLHPTDVAIHPDGNIWVADSENDRISQFTRDGKFLREWSGGGKDRLYRPTGLDIDAHGDFVVRDFEKSFALPQVAKYGVSGSAIWSHSMTDTQVDGEFPFQGVALLPDGTALITDPKAAEFALLQVLPNGTTRQWGAWRSRSPMQLERPIAVALDSQLLGVVDAANHRAVILRRDPDRYYKFLGMMGPPFKPEFDLIDPMGIAIHRTGPDINDAEVYVVDREQHSVYIADPTGESLGRWGDGTPRSGDDGFKSPRGICVAPNGDVYIADTGNNRIVRRSPGPKGTLKNIIGRAGDGDGEVEYPSSVTYGPGDYVFVLELGKNRLQMFTPEGGYVDDWDSGGGRNIEPGDLWFPQALSSDGTYLYVLESDAPWDHVRVQVLDPRAGVPLADSVVAIFPDPVARPGPGVEELWGPLGISAIAEGLIAIADAGNSRVVTYRWGDGSTAPTPTATPTDEPPTATATATSEPPTEPATATATTTSPPLTATDEPPSPTSSVPPNTLLPPTSTNTPSATSLASPTRTPTDPPSPIIQPTPVYRVHVYMPLTLKTYRFIRRR